MPVVCKFSGAVIDEIYSATKGTQPHIVLCVFIHRPDRVVVQALTVDIVLSIIMKCPGLRSQDTQSPVLRSDPDIVLIVFFQRQYNIARKTIPVTGVVYIMHELAA